MPAIRKLIAGDNIALEEDVVLEQLRVKATGLVTSAELLAAEASKGAGKVAFAATLAYAAGTVGSKLRDVVDVFTAGGFTSAEIADVRSNTGAIDVGAKVLAAHAAAKVLRKRLIFPAGFYRSSVTYAFGGDTGVWLEGEGAVYLHCTAAGPVVSFDSGGPTIRKDAITFKNFVLLGNAASTHGLYTRGMVRSRVQDIRVVNVAAAAFRFEWSVLNTYKRIVVSDNIDSFTVIPARGLELDHTSAGTSYACTANTFEDVMFEGPISDVGIDIKSGALNCFVGGTAENIQRGTVIRADAFNNSFYGFDWEGNALNDLEVFGRGTCLYACNASSGASLGAVLVRAAAEGTRFVGGFFLRVDLDPASKGTVFDGASVSDSGGLGITSTGPYQAFGVNKLNSSFLQTGLQDFGPWTPGIQGATTPGAQTYGSARVGYYQRVGRVVHFQAYVDVLTNAGGAGSATLTGLPFAALNAANMVVEVLFTHNGGVVFAGSNDRVAAQIAPNATGAVLIESVGGKAASALPIGSIGPGIYSIAGSYISER